MGIFVPGHFPLDRLLVRFLRPESRRVNMDFFRCKGKARSSRQSYCHERLLLLIYFLYDLFARKK